MRRQLTALTVAAALAPALVACGGDDQTSASPSDTSSSSSPSSSSTSAAADCDGFLTQADAETLAGGTLSAGQAASQGDIQACQWKGATSGVQALKAPAQQWVTQLPAMIQQYETSGTKVPASVQAKVAQGLKMIKEKKQISDDQACGLFAELSKIPDAGTDAGTITTVLPSEQKPQGVTAQACTDGTYWSVTVAYKTLDKADVDATVSRADDALTTLDS